jgi:threonine synthase
MAEPELSGPVVSLACAHPAKFPEIISTSINHTPPVPDFLDHLLRKQERTTILPADEGAVRAFIESL